MSEPETNSIECPSLMELAAYHDGRLDAALRHTVQSHVAACSICRDALHDVAELAADGSGAMMFVPPSVIDRAMAIVPSQTITISHPSRTLIHARRFAALAASIAVGVAGYHIGGMLVLPTQASAAEQDVDYFFGLLDANEQDQIVTDWLAFDDSEVTS